MVSTQTRNEEDFHPNGELWYCKLSVSIISSQLIKTKPWNSFLHAKLFENFSACLFFCFDLFPSVFFSLLLFGVKNKGEILNSWVQIHKFSFSWFFLSLSLSTNPSRTQTHTRTLTHRRSHSQSPCSYSHSYISLSEYARTDFARGVLNRGELCSTSIPERDTSPVVAPAWPIPSEAKVFTFKDLIKKVWL